MKFLLNYSIVILLIKTCLSNVLELNNKFLEIYNKDPSRSFLIKFYAPWCHHCRQIEQTYNEVARLVKHLGNQNLIVGKIDCTKYTGMANHFGVRGFPTIMYIDSQRQVEFVGDRNKEDMLEFVKRLNGPAIRKLSNCDDLEKIKKQNSAVFFINFAKEPSLNYTETANQFQSTDWFYHLDKPCSNHDFNSIYCIKTSLRNNVILKKYDHKIQLNDWIRLERFPKFMRISLSNINYLMNTGKLLVIVLIKEFSTKKEREHYETLEHLANTYPHEDQFIFGWADQLVVNSIAIQTISPIPNYIFINSTTMNYYLYPENDEKQLIKILDSFVNKKPILMSQGGNTYLHQIKRLGYDGFIAISLMFESNPFLTIILFGLPITFFSIIIYCSCCSDSFDIKSDFDEEEERLSEHEDEENDTYELDEEEMIEYEFNEEENLINDDENNLTKENVENEDHLKSD